MKSPNANDAIKRGMQTIEQIGCDRVLTTHEGGSVPYKNATEEFLIEVEIILIRNDGWTLGCHRTMFPNAYSLWENEWVAALIKPMGDPITIDLLKKIDIGTILPPLTSIPPKIKQPKNFK